MISFTEFDKSDPETLKFVASNCNSSFVNAIRRTIITDIETLSFSTEDYMSSDLKVIENTSSLNNEFLLHRLGLLPIYTKNIETFDPSNYKFILKVVNDSSAPIDVTTKDFVVMNLQTGKPENVVDFFPANKITGDHILITKLKNNPTGEGEKLHIEGKCSKSIGSEHIRFSPVSCVMFINKRDPKRVDSAFNEYISKLETKPEESELKRLAKKFDIEEADRYFHIDENGDPNQFDFTIESAGVIPPHRILINSLLKLSQKLKTFMSNLEAAMDAKESPVTVKESSGLMSGFDITIDEESHTLGFILQTYINRVNPDVFVGYMNPHPLQKNIKIRVNFNDSNINTVKDVFRKTCDYLTTTLDGLRKEMLKEFEGKVILKIPKKKQ